MPDILPTTQISRVEGPLATRVESETVLMHVARGNYYGLARTALCIWSLLEVPVTFDTLCNHLQARFACPAQGIQADTQRFV